MAMKTPSKRANGGTARAKSLSPARRKEIAKKAAATRWAKNEKEDRGMYLPLVKTAKDKAWEEFKRHVFELGIDMPGKQAKERPNGETGTLRDQIAQSVLTGLYSNIADSQKFAAFVIGAAVLLPEAFTRIAYSQADEALRLRSL